VAGQTGRTGNFNVNLPTGTTQTSFVVRQVVVGQAATIPLTVVDGCGDWPTVVGGGPAAFGAQAPAAAVATCTPRPAVTVAATPSGPGRLLVSVRPTAGGGSNALRSLRFGTATNALVDAGDHTGSGGDFTLALEPGAIEAVFAVRRATAGQAVTVPLTVTDSCGDWPTLVGGGPQAFGGPSPSGPGPTATATPAPGGASGAAPS